ncbi:MAG TPA: hypothetical protein PLI13_12035, partial [Paracoccus sp. (in: a-proteobacteria)]|nr:hypothetical protein [Paracoccus sp. (in: a-proteobacteria)]
LKHGPIALVDEETPIIALAPLEVWPQVRYEAGLYQASAEKMLAILRTAKAPTVMMIGHNPGIAELAAMLPARVPLDPD